METGTASFKSPVDDLANPALHEVLIALMGEGVVVQGAGGEVISCNPAAERILGLSADQMAGRTSLDPRWRAVDEAGLDLPGERHPAMVALRERREVRDFVMSVHKPDGSQCWILVNSSYFRHPETGSDAVVSVFSDITLLRRTHTRSQNFFNLSLDLLCVADLEGNFIEVNPAFSETLGYETEEILSSPFLELVHPDDLAPTLAELEALADGERTLNFENRYRTADGSYCWLSWVARTGQDNLVYAVAHDVTTAKAAKMALDEYARQLEKSNSSLAQFAHVASHDLQEPLRTLISYSDLLQERYADRMAEDGEMAVGFIRDAAAQMTQRVQSVLSYSRLGQQGVQLEHFAVRLAVERALAGLEAQIFDAKATVSLGPLPEVQADETLLGLVFQNLISNAIKFRGDEAPRVSVLSTEIEGGWRFTVEDNGIGIPVEHRTTVFAVFKRLHSRDHYPGTGMGLPVCRRIIEDHGGRIWITEGAEGGTAVHFTIPTPGA